MSTFRTFKCRCPLRQLVATKDTTTDGAQASIETGNETATLLAPDALMDEVEVDELYLGVVIERVHYGLFVRLTNGTAMTDQITGLAHFSNFPPGVEVADVDLYEKVAVRVVGITPDGPELELVESMSDMDDGASVSTLLNAGEQPLTAPDVDQSEAVDVLQGIRDTIDEVATGDDGRESFAADPLRNVAFDLLRFGDDGGLDGRVVTKQSDYGAVWYEVEDDDADVESFAADPLKNIAVDLLRLVDEDVSADRVVKEQTRDGDVRYEVVVEPDVQLEVTL